MITQQHQYNELARLERITRELQPERRDWTGKEEWQNSMDRYRKFLLGIPEEKHEDEWLKVNKVSVEYLKKGFKI